MSSDAFDPRPRGGTSRFYTRLGLVHVHRTTRPKHRVLLLDSRRDGLGAHVEKDVADRMSGAGAEIDLDAISDPRSVLRVLDMHPEVLDAYDAVVAVAPTRTDWRGSRIVLTHILGRLRHRVPILLIDRGTQATDGENAGLAGLKGGAIPTLRVLQMGDSIDTSRRISHALRAILETSSAPQRPISPLLAQLPIAASQLRAEIGSSTIGRIERIVESAREHFGLDAAEVNLLQNDLVVTVASAGARPRTTPSTDSLCTLALQNAGTTVMPDTWLDPDACRRPPTYDPNAVRFYAGCPIRSSTGDPVGMLCLWDYSPQNADGVDLALLQDLALLVEGELIHA